MIKMMIKEVQYHQLKHLVTYATCDNDCDDCDWKDEFHDSKKYNCLLEQLQDLIKMEKEIADSSKVDYLKHKK